MAQKRTEIPEIASFKDMAIYVDERFASMQNLATWFIGIVIAVLIGVGGFLFTQISDAKTEINEHKSDRELHSSQPEREANKQINLDIKERLTSIENKIDRISRRNR